MKIRSFLLAFFVLVISCVAYSQDSTKTTMHHHTAITHHRTAVKYHKHRKHVIKEGSKADRKEDKKEASEKKAATEKKTDKK